MNELMARMRARRPFYWKGFRYEAGDPIREEDRAEAWTLMGSHYIELVREAPKDKIERKPKQKEVAREDA